MEEQDKPTVADRQDKDSVNSQCETDIANNRLSSCYKKEPHENEESAILEIVANNSISSCDNGNIEQLDDASDVAPNGDGITNTDEGISNAGEKNSNTCYFESDTDESNTNHFDSKPNPSENSVEFLTTGLGCLKIKSNIPEIDERLKSVEKGPAKIQVDKQNIQSSSHNLPALNSASGTEDVKERMVTQSKTALQEITTNASDVDQTLEECSDTTYCTNSPDRRSNKIQTLRVQKEDIIKSPELQNSNKEELTQKRLQSNEKEQSTREVLKPNEMQMRNEEPTQMDMPTPMKVLEHFATTPRKVYLPSVVGTPNILPVHNEVLVLSEDPQRYELLSQAEVPTYRELPSDNRQTREGQISKPLVESGFRHTMQEKTSSEDQSSVNEKSVTFSARETSADREDTKANAKKKALGPLDTLETSACKSAGEEIKRSLNKPSPNSPLKYTYNTTNVVLPHNWNMSYKRQHHCRPKKTFKQMPLDSWVPQLRPPQRSGKPPYNEIRRQKYIKTSVDQKKLNPLIQFYENKTVVDAESEDSAVNLVDDILEKMLSNTFLTLSNQFSTEAHDEGSVTVDTKVGKLDESDHSVEILVEDRDEIILSDEPFDVEYSQDDIDAYVINEIPVTAFVKDGKRLFPGVSRPLEAETDPGDVPVGYIAVRLGLKDARRFAECCISRNKNDFGWILPYQVLNKFHRGIGRSLEISDLAGVTLNNGARGPAITLTVQQEYGPNISVDITPKLSLPKDILNITHFKWPRKDTSKWLLKSKVKRVADQPLYLVPKGDKYWKISFANLENELLDDIDDKTETWRKECLKIMKKKLLQWKSKSSAGLKGISSYLLKTTLLWLCEILPDDQYWSRDQLANRYLNFVQELEHRLKKRSLGEYFNPSVNLLKHKTDEDIEELRTFLNEEIKLLTEKQDGAE